jgi:membrane-associated phospholipid phosphatase
MRWLAAILSLCAATASAQSVYRVRESVDWPLSIAAGAAVIVPYALSKQLIEPRCPCDSHEVNRFDRRAIGNQSMLANVISDVSVGLSLTVPLALDAWTTGWNRTLYEDALVFAETLALNGALVTFAKYLAQRPLPRTYAGDRALLDSPGGYRSFYSGHTSLVFAALSVTAMTARLRYGERWWPWVITGAVGVSVAVERVADGRHFPSDVMLGAAVGSALGIVVPWLHARASGFYAAPLQRGLLFGYRRAL